MSYIESFRMPTTEDWRLLVCECLQQSRSRVDAPVTSVDMEAARAPVDQPGKATINDMPVNVLLHIFSYCSTRDLVYGVRHVTPYWEQLAADRYIWSTRAVVIPRSPRIDMETNDILRYIHGLCHFRIEPTVSDYNRLSERAFMDALHAMPRLEVLDLSCISPLPGHELMTPHVFKLLGTLCPKLREFNLVLMEDIHPECFHMLDGNTSLRSLSFSGYYPYCLITNVTLMTAVRFLPRLVELELDNCPHINDRSLQAIATEIPLLEKLWIIRPGRYTAAGLCYIGDMHKLTSLKLEDFDRLMTLTTALLRIAEGCPLLRELSLRNMRKFDHTTTYDLVTKLKHLTSLNLAFCSLRDTCILHISAHCCNLRSLDIRGNDDITCVAMPYLVMDTTALPNTLREFLMDDDLIADCPRRQADWLYVTYPMLRHHRAFTHRRREVLRMAGEDSILNDLLWAMSMPNEDEEDEDVEENE